MCACGCTVDRGELHPSGGGGGGEDDRGQLAECLAFISDMALTGDSEAGSHRVDVAGPSSASTPLGQQRTGAASHDDNEVNQPLVVMVMSSVASVGLCTSALLQMSV